MLEEAVSYALTGPPTLRLSVCAQFQSLIDLYVGTSNDEVCDVT